MHKLACLRPIKTRCGRSWLLMNCSSSWVCVGHVHNTHDQSAHSHTPKHVSLHASNTLSASWPTCTQPKWHIIKTSRHVVRHPKLVLHFPKVASLISFMREMKSAWCVSKCPQLASFYFDVQASIRHISTWCLQVRSVQKIIPSLRYAQTWNKHFFCSLKVRMTHSQRFGNMKIVRTSLWRDLMHW